ncbi:hypothetical protein ACOSP7_006719 [Xanthoceras sorbifolium]
MTRKIREEASSTRPPFLDRSSYAFKKAHMRAYLKANNERVWIFESLNIGDSSISKQKHGYHKLEFYTCDDGEEMWMIVRKLKKFSRGKRTDSGFKGANVKKEFVPRKFENDKGKSEGV